jgi:hypothetical protein
MNSKRGKKNPKIYPKLLILVGPKTKLFMPHDLAASCRRSRGKVGEA